MNLFQYASSFAVLVAFSSCDMREARLKDFDKDRWIQVALGEPLPKGITNLEGIGDTWQGFWCHFRFCIPAGDLQEHLDSNGYEEYSTADCARYFTIDDRFEEYFSPKWAPDLASKSRVFFRTLSGYSTHVLVNPETDVVHVWTGGGSSPGPFPSNQPESVEPSPDGPTAPESDPEPSVRGLND